MPPRCRKNPLDAARYGQWNDLKALGADVAIGRREPLLLAKVQRDVHVAQHFHHELVGAR